MFSLSLPKWMYVAIAVAALLLMGVGLAISEPKSMRTYATEAGLPTDFALETRETEGDFIAYFTTGGVVCMWVFCVEVPPHIYVAAPATWPREHVLAVLFHEIGHYHQWREGWDAPSEWDADVRSARHLCSLGLNGPELVAGALDALTARAKKDSPAHGNHYRRIEHARSYGCRGAGLSLLDVNQT